MEELQAQEAALSRSSQPVSEELSRPRVNHFQSGWTPSFQGLKQIDRIHLDDSKKR